MVTRRYLVNRGPVIQIYRYRKVGHPCSGYGSVYEAGDLPEIRSRPVKRKFRSDEGDESDVSGPLPRHTSNRCHGSYRNWSTTDLKTNSDTVSEIECPPIALLIHVFLGVTNVVLSSIDLCISRHQ
jgi:hypothetical protein